MNEAMSDTRFLEALESCRLPAAEFDHRAHVRAAYLYLLDTDFGTALASSNRIVDGSGSASVSLGSTGTLSITIAQAARFFAGDLPGSVTIMSPESSPSGKC